MKDINKIIIGIGLAGIAIYSIGGAKAEEILPYKVVGFSVDTNKCTFPRDINTTTVLKNISPEEIVVSPQIVVDGKVYDMMEGRSVTMQPEQTSGGIQYKVSGLEIGTHTIYPLPRSAEFEEKIEIVEYEVPYTREASIIAWEIQYGADPFRLGVYVSNGTESGEYYIHMSGDTTADSPPFYLEGTPEPLIYAMSVPFTSIPSGADIGNVELTIIKIV